MGPQLGVEAFVAAAYEGSVVFTFTTALPLPRVPAFAGAILYQQMALLELVGGSIQSITSTNALQLTVGLF